MLAEAVAEFGDVPVGAFAEPVEPGLVEPLEGVGLFRRGEHFGAVGVLGGQVPVAGVAAFLAGRGRAVGAVAVGAAGVAAEAFAGYARPVFLAELAERRGELLVLLTPCHWCPIGRVRRRGRS